MKQADERVGRHKIKVLKYAKEIDHITKTCRYFGISRELHGKTPYERLRDRMTV